MYKVSQNFTEGNTSKLSACFLLFACLWRHTNPRLPSTTMRNQRPSYWTSAKKLIMLFHYFFTLYLSLVYTVSYFDLFPVLQNSRTNVKFSLYLKKAGLASRNIVYTYKKILLRCVSLQCRRILVGRVDIYFHRLFRPPSWYSGELGRGKKFTKCGREKEKLGKGEGEGKEKSFLFPSPPAPHPSDILSFSPQFSQSAVNPK